MQNMQSNWPADYFMLRDFEIVQPLYDLAFLLQVIPLAKNKEVSKYRTLSLSMVAHSLDSYSTGISRWIEGALTDNDVDFVPSPKIKGYLSTIINSGTIDELNDFLSEKERACLRLRSISGLGKQIISEFYSCFPKTPQGLLMKAARRSGINEDNIISVLNGRNYGPWQSAHLIPPLIRLLHYIEEACAQTFQWQFNNLKDSLFFIKEPFQVILCSAAKQKIYKTISNTVAKEPFFSIETWKDNVWRIRHSMGWSFELKIEHNEHNEVNGHSLLDLARRYDPLVRDLPKFLLSDLHLHTSWSDGLATPGDMVATAAKSGLKYVAITDHSQSAKLQKGLNAPSWIRQAIAINNTELACPVLHGLEVDILQNGRLDTPTGLLNGMDFIVGSFHVGLKQSKERNTNRLIRAIESSQIDVIGHPTAKLVGRPGEPNYYRPPIDADWNAVFDKCIEWGVALEINCFPSRLDIGGELLKRAVEAGCWLSIGTDAHARLHLDNIKFGAAIASNYRSAKILNYLTYDEIKAWIEKARTKRNNKKGSFRGIHQGILFKSDAKIDANRSKLYATVSSRQRVPNGSVVVGLDLTASKNKKTGVAKLFGNNVETVSLASDEELLNYIKDTSPSIVSIDSPLGLPGGGHRIEKEAGIVRVAEHDLASVGIPAYPALIDSMKQLTLRGMKLKKAIESFDKGPAVIESYPGAAQDILSIPRKQRGLSLLRAGLRNLGIVGSGLETTSHDEMDAITSALVGRYYEASQFEAMGVPAEAQLIVPRIQIMDFDLPPVIIISGKTGAGKSVVSRYIALNYGFRWIKTRDVVKSLLLEDFDGIASHKMKLAIGQEITERNLLDGGKIIMENYGQAPIRERITSMILEKMEPTVVDAVRSTEDLDLGRLKEREIVFWFVNCPDSLIAKRWLGRNPKKTVSNPVSYNLIDKHLVTVRENVDLVLDNSSSLDNLHNNVDELIFNWVSLV